LVDGALCGGIDRVAADSSPFDYAQGAE
jgi:hypothetical protein